MANIKEFRPSSFSDVIGNENQIKLIKNSLSEGTLPSFILLTGKAGIGKTTLSKLIAKSVSCEKPINGVACDMCPTCMKVNGRFILGDDDVENIITYRMSDEGGKIAARAIQEQIKTKPIGGGKKVILLEECQGMRHDAQDLLLPILEYIPEHTHIIAMTTDESKLQNTFVSRAVTYRLVQPSQQQVEMLLADASKRMGINIAGNTVIPRLVEYGIRPRESLNLLLKVSQISKQITINEVNEYLNLVDDSLYLRYLEYIKGDMGMVLDFLEQLKTTGTDVASFMRGLNSFIIRLLTFKYRKAYIQDSIEKQCREFIKHTDDRDLLYIQSIIAEEVKKFGQEEYDEAQFISTAFRIQDRNHESLKEKAFASAKDVLKEKGARQSALSEQVNQKFHGVSKKSLDAHTDMSTFLANIPGAKVVDNGGQS